MVISYPFEDGTVKCYDLDGGRIRSIELDEIKKAQKVRKVDVSIDYVTNTVRQSAYCVMTEDIEYLLDSE